MSSAPPRSLNREQFLGMFRECLTTVANRVIAGKIQSFPDSRNVMARIFANEQDREAKIKEVLDATTDSAVDLWNHAQTDFENSADLCVKSADCDLRHEICRLTKTRLDRTNQIDQYHDGKQGVYLHVMRLHDPEYKFWLYVGCSYGLSKGLWGRIEEHNDPAYRAKNGCLHYVCMEREGVNAKFGILVRYQETVHIWQCLWAESAPALLFGSLQYETYRQMRSELSIPQRVVPYAVATNKSEPMITENYSYLSSVIRYEAREWQRERLRDGGYFKVNNRRRNDVRGWRQFFFVIGRIEIPIMSEFASAISIKDLDWVEVKCVLDGEDHCRWARRAIPTDAAYRLSIRVRKVLSHGMSPPVRLYRETASSIAFGNSIADWIEGKINPEDSSTMDESYYGSTRFPLFGKWRDCVSTTTWDVYKKKYARLRYIARHGRDVPVSWKLLGSTAPGTVGLESEPSSESEDDLAIDVSWLALAPASANLPIPAQRATFIDVRLDNRNRRRYPHRRDELLAIAEFLQIPENRRYVQSRDAE